MNKFMEKYNATTILLMGVSLFLLSLTSMRHSDDLKDINNKLDAIASRTEDTADKVDNLDSDFVEYRKNNKDVIDMLNQQLNNFIEDMENEIDRIDKDIESVEIAKAEERQKKSITYTPVTYYASTDGLTASSGVNYYGDQKETYYNLNMNRVVSNAQNSGLEGDYWVRDDGVKMYGPYVIVAANQEVHPYGTTVDTSLGEGIVLDTGSFATGNPTQVDIATDW